MPESRVRKSVDDKRKRVETAKAAAKTPSSTAKTGATSVKTTSSADKTASGSKETGTKETGSKQSRSTASKATATATAKRVSRRIEQESKPKSRRWLLPAAIVLAVLGAAWGAAYFVRPKLIPGEHGLGNWNILIGAGAIVVAAIGYLLLRPSNSMYNAGSRRWVPPTFITVGLLGVAWLIVYYVAGSSVPFMNTLGNWNILIGMAGMAGAFIIATLWK